MIKSVIRSFLINLLAFWLISTYISGVQIVGDWKNLVIFATGFMVLHIILKPLLGIFLGALNFLTFGIIGILVDTGILYALWTYSHLVVFTEWDFPGYNFSGLVLPAAHLVPLAVIFLAALIINAIRSTLTMLSE